MLESPSASSSDELAEALFRRAVALWGKKRANELRPLLEQTVDYIWTLSKIAPDFETEPAFYV